MRPYTGAEPGRCPESILTNESLDGCPWSSQSGSIRAGCTSLEIRIFEATIPNSNHHDVWLCKIGPKRVNFIILVRLSNSVELERRFQVNNGEAAKCGRNQSLVRARQRPACSHCNGSFNLLHAIQPKRPDKRRWSVISFSIRNNI